MSNLKKAKQPPPPIKLFEEEQAQGKKGDHLKIDIRSVPEDPNSKTFSLDVRFFQSGTPKQWLDFKKTFDKVIVGQNLTTGPTRYQMARTLLKGEALRVFNLSTMERGTETVEHFNQVMDDVTAHFFPKKPIAKQKRYFRRQLRKPCDSTIRQFVMSLSDANQDLCLYPGATEDTPLPEDELCELVEWASPNVWQWQTLIQGFDTTEHSLTEFVEFLERLETAEEIYDSNYQKKGQSANASQKGSNKSETQRSAKSQRGQQNNQKGAGSQKWCPLHQVNSHDISECKVVLSQVEKMKSAWQAGGTRMDNKCQKREGGRYERGRKEEDLNAIAERAVIKALEKKAAKKKKKAQLKKESEDEFCDAVESLSLSSSDESSDSE
mgnify:CR=1 FL=1